MYQLLKKADPHAQNSKAAPARKRRFHDRFAITSTGARWALNLLLAEPGGKDTPRTSSRFVTILPPSNLVPRAYVPEELKRSTSFRVVKSGIFCHPQMVVTTA